MKRPPNNSFKPRPLRDHGSKQVARVRPKAEPGNLRRGMPLIAPGARFALTRATAYEAMTAIVQSTMQSSRHISIRRPSGRRAGRAPFFDEAGRLVEKSRPRFRRQI